MGCGNCCVFGRYEGLYYIDNDDFHVFRRADAASDDCPEPRLMRDLDYEELTDGTWLYDDLATELEEEAFWSALRRTFCRCSPVSSESARSGGSPAASGPSWRAHFSISALRTTSGRWRWNSSRKSRHGVKVTLAFNPVTIKPI